jgi:hypothetical protein
MNVTIDDRQADEYTDEELIAWLNDRVQGNKLRASTAHLWVAVIRAFDDAGPPMTLRQLFYALVSAGAIAKTEEAYKQVGYHLVRMRRKGVIPYSFVADNTRWMRKPNTWSSMEAYLRAGQEAYRHAVWDIQKAYVEIWCEKDALAGVLYGVTEKWDVPLMVTRGYPSETFVYEAAQALKQRHQDVYLYYFGDHDPSGKDIPRNTAQKLREFGAKFHFEHVAVLPWQIGAWGLPTRPTKSSDSRARDWEGGSVELDAIPVAKLRAMVERAITKHIDQYLLEKTLQIEKAERETLGTVMENLGLAQTFQPDIAGLMRLEDRTRSAGGPGG